MPTYSLDFLHNLDTRAMTDPGAILGVDDDPEKISDQVLFAVPQIIAPKPIHRGRGISPWVGGSAVSQECGLQCSP
jgi:hypothetical protein